MVGVASSHWTSGVPGQVQAHPSGVLDHISPATRRDADDLFGPEMSDARDPEYEFRLRGRTAMKRIAFASVFTLALVAAGHAAASATPLANLSIESVRFLAGGALKTTAAYACPSGFEPLLEQFENLAHVDQLRGVAHRMKYFGSRIVCDDSEHPLSVKFRPTSQKTLFDPDEPITVSFHMTVSGGAGGDLRVGDDDTWLRRRPIADIDVRNVTFLSRKEGVRVGASYTCADGYEPVDSLAELLTYTRAGPNSKGFTSRITCDGTYHKVEVIFRRTARGRRFDPGVRAAAFLAFRADSVDRTIEVLANNSKAVVLNR
jgi:hypothetical protein